MSDAIIISIMAVFGVLLMGFAIFAKKEDIEESSASGSDLFTLIAKLVFVLSPVIIKRILLFILGFLWTGFLLFILILGEY